MPSGIRCTQEEVIARFRARHGDKYDYSKVVFTRMKDDVIVICPIHGEFKISAHNHARGTGCAACAGKCHTMVDRIEKAREVHSVKFEYLPFDFKNGDSVMNIICSAHGLFHRTVQQHINEKNGCPYCYKESRTNANNFEERARDKHGDKYEYLDPYIKSDQEIRVRCKIHDIIFKIKPRDHIRGQGCRLCGIERVADNCRLTFDEFVERSNIKHNFKYDYSESKYINGRTPTTIICPIHGPFPQTPEMHMYGHGCPYCKESYGEKEIAKWLDENNIGYKREYFVYPKQLSLIGRNKFRVDFFIPKHNIIIEYHGEQHYNKHKFFHESEEKFQDQLDRDKRLRDYCKENKIRLIEIPYTKLKEIDKILDKKLGRLK